MTHIEELKAATTLIREECKKHNMCRDCPLWHVTCSRGINYPASWPAERIGVEDDE